MIISTGIVDVSGGKNKFLSEMMTFLLEKINSYRK